MSNKILWSLSLSNSSKRTHCSLRKRCPYSENFRYVFSPNAGKYGPEYFRIRILFIQWLFVGLHTVNLLGNYSFVEFSETLLKLPVIFSYTLCYKEHGSINWRSVNSTATKHYTYQSISKSIECETDKM